MGWQEQRSARRARVLPRPGSLKGNREGVPWSRRTHPGHWAGSGPRIQAPRDAVAQTKLGLRDARSVGPRGRAPRPRRATTYTKTPKSRARTPISMASSRMVRPEQLRGGGSWCSRRLPQLGRRRLARPGARGRRSRPRAGAGGGSRAGAGAVGRNQRHPPPRAPALRRCVPAPSEGRLGDSPLPRAASAPWARAGGPRPGREARGSPAASSPRAARSPLPAAPCAFPPGLRLALRRPAARRTHVGR